MFDPKTNKYPYPLATDQHYLEVKKDRGIVFDENYPYIDHSPRFRFVDNLYRVMLNLIVFPLLKVRLGLKVHGKENLKKHREVIEKGVVSCCNHVHMWDYLGIMSAIRPRRPHILSWAPNINGENGTMIRHVGGIPIPQTKSALLTYETAVNDMIQGGGWLHIYAEGSMWEYYAPIRPFKRGAFYFACENERPVIPMAYSYREPGWIRKHIFRQIACFTLTIGEPIYPDPELKRRRQQLDLCERCHREVCRLAGIDPEENIYPPVFHNSERIDYYTDTYGVGYRGSR